MTLDQRLTRAMHQIADGVSAPEVDLGAVRSRAHRNRRRAAALTVTAAVVAIAAAGAALVGGRDLGAPESVDPVGPPRIGGPPLTPYWHDGVLHVRGIEIKTTTPIGQIEVAGDTVLVSPISRGKLPTWALVRGDRIAPLPAGEDDVRLTLDGRIAYWGTHPTANSTHLVAWDTETNRELASRNLPRQDGADAGPRLYLAGIDPNGMAYWVDEASEVDVKRWDVRADTVEPVPDLSASDLTYADGIGLFFPDQYVSPDGTQEIFTGNASGEPTTDCWPACKIQLRVRPAGSDDPGNVVTLRLPEDTLYEHLWDPETDIGGRHMDAWWETNETVLVQTTDDSNRKALLRCSVTSGACQHVFKLGVDGREWRHWAFARYPIE